MVGAPKEDEDEDGAMAVLMEAQVLDFLELVEAGAEAVEMVVVVVVAAAAAPAPAVTADHGIPVSLCVCKLSRHWGCARQY